MNLKKIMATMGVVAMTNFALSGPLFAITAQDNGKIKYYSDKDNAFDIKGYVNGVLQSSTYSDNGYGTCLKVDSNPQVIYSGCKSDTYTLINGIQTKIDLEYMNDGLGVKIKYTLKNTNPKKSIISLGTMADVQVAGNDKATLERLNNGLGVRLYSTKSPKVQYSFYGKSVVGVTDVDNIWIGKHPDQGNNIFNGNNLDKIENIDSAFAYSWVNREIEPNETKEFSVYMTLGTVNSAPTITTQTNLIFNNGNKVIINGTINDSDIGDKVTIYYTIDGGSVHTLANKITSNGTNQDFSIDLSDLGLSNGYHNIKVWAVDGTGNPSTYTTSYMTIGNQSGSISGIGTSGNFADKDGNYSFKVGNDLGTPPTGGTYQYKVGNGGWINCDNTTTYTINGITNSTTITVRIVDKNGNPVSSESQTVITQDSQGPTNNFSFNNGKITVNITDSGSGINSTQYMWTNTNVAPSISDTNWSNLNGDVGYNGSSNSDIYLWVKSTDNVGNTTIQSQKVSGPKAPSFNCPVNKVVFIPFEITITDSVNDTSTIAYYIIKIGDGSWQKVPANGKFNVNLSDNKDTTISVKAVDVVGRESDETTITIPKNNTVAPAPNVNVPDRIIGNEVEIDVSNNDNKDKQYEIKINDEEFKKVEVDENGKIHIEIPENKTSDIVIRVIDKNGNPSEEITKQIQSITELPNTGCNY